MSMLNSLFRQSSLKTASTVLVAFLLVLVLDGCKKCKNEAPSAQIINNGTKVASVQIKTSNGNTENINNVEPGTSSGYRSYAPGEVIFTITVDKINYVQAVQLGNCYEYTIAIDASNNITTAATNRND